MSKVRGYLAKAKKCEERARRCVTLRTGMATYLSARLSNAGGGRKRTRAAALVAWAVKDDPATL
jgi:hypothetical protein